MAGRLSAFELNMDATMRNLKDFVYMCPYTQKQIAQYMGYEEKTIYNWVNGHTIPQIGELRALCKILRIDLDDILVDNYQIQYPDYEQRKEFLKNAIFSHMEDGDDERIIRSIAMDELEAMESPAYTINEMMMYLNLMDEKSFKYLRLRMDSVGFSKEDTRFIRKVFKYIVEKEIEESPEKERIRNRIEYCSHQPHILYTTDKSPEYKKNRLMGLIDKEKSSWDAIKS